MRVLVTGGSGFVGTRLKIHKPQWVYVSSKDFSLFCGQCGQFGICGEIKWVKTY